LVWGGLRGAVGLALAIIVDETEQHKEVDTKQKSITFLIGGVALLTLLINGTTCGWLLTKLALVEISQGKKVILAYVQNKIYRDINEQYRQLAASEDFSEHNMDMVNKWCSVLRKEDFCQVTPREALSRGAADQECAVDTELMQVTREVFLQATQACYWELKEKGEFPGGFSSEMATTMLLQAVDHAQDRTDEGLYDWEYIHGRMKHPDSFHWLSDRLSTVSEDHSEMQTYLVQNYIKAHQLAASRVCEFFGKDTSADTPEEKEVMKESHACIEQARTFLEDMDQTMIKLVTTKQVASQILKRQMQEIEQVHQQGLLTASEARVMESNCLEELQQIVEHKPSCGLLED